MSNTELHDELDIIESHTGDGTELVTVTIPAEKSLNSVQKRVRGEYASAEHIKSDKTRERVQQALSRIQRHIRQYDATPENGLVVYAGVVDGELVSYVFDSLPKPVTDSLYHCDDHFDTDVVGDILSPEDSVGLIVIERGGAAIGQLAGDCVTPLRTFESHVMGKTRAGGQSAQRFKRERERQMHEFFQRVASSAAEAFLSSEDTIAGLAIGGTVGTAKEFANGNYLDYRLQDCIVGTYSVEYANTQGLHQLVSQAQPELLDAQYQQEREVLDEFFTRLRDGEPVAYGVDELEEAIVYGAVETAILSTTVTPEQREKYQQTVAQQGGETVIVSTDTEKGAQYGETFGGLGALLRFPIN